MSKIQIHINSDLYNNVYRMSHQHFPHIYWMPERDDVVFVGDMSEGMDIVSKIKLYYPNKPIFWVQGDHEFYKHNLQNMRGDYEHIDADTNLPMISVEMFNVSMKFIDLTLCESFDESSVIVMHHFPSAQSLDTRYYNLEPDPAFASNINWVIEKHQPDIWVHGHTHFSRDYAIGHTWVICNPGGYDWSHGAENPNWNTNLIVEI